MANSWTHHKGTMIGPFYPEVKETTKGWFARIRIDRMEMTSCGELSELAAVTELYKGLYRFLELMEKA